MRLRDSTRRIAVGLLNDHIAHCVTAAARGTQADAGALLAEVAAAIRQVVLRVGVLPGLPCFVVEQAA